MLFLFVRVAVALLSYVGPWWMIAPVCFVGCWWLSSSPLRAFWHSAGAGAAVWVGYGSYLHVTTGSGLPVQMAGRSEEHTSELQSLMRISYAVFCLKQKKLDHYRNKTEQA